VSYAPLGLPLWLRCAYAPLFVIFEFLAFDFDLMDRCFCLLRCAPNQACILTKLRALLEVANDEPDIPKHEPEERQLTTVVYQEICEFIWRA
jgi:hypothetical protein